MLEDTPKDKEENISDSESKYIDFSASEKLLESIGYKSFEEVPNDKLIGLIYEFIENSKKINLQLSQLIQEKELIQDNFNSTLRKVAKWENDKNIMLSIMKKENEKIQQLLIENIIEVIDTIESFEGISEEISKLTKPTVEKIIDKFNLEVINLDKFDPQKHVAIDKISEGKNIYKCIKKGYIYKSKVIRFASVLLD